MYVRVIMYVAQFVAVVCFYSKLLLSPYTFVSCETKTFLKRGDGDGADMVVVVVRGQIVFVTGSEIIMALFGAIYKLRISLAVFYFLDVLSGSGWLFLA